MVTDEVEIELNTRTNATIAKNINYNECCLFGDETVYECDQLDTVSLTD